MTADEIDQLNTAVDAWGNQTLSQIKARYMALINSPKRSGDGFESLGYSIGKSYGVPERISYKFNRYLVFVQRGTGRGRPLGSMKVKPKPWLNPVLDEQVPKLADIVATFKGDMAVRKVMNGADIK